METYNIKQQEQDNKTYGFYTVLGSHDYLDEEKNPRLSSSTSGDVLAKFTDYSNGRIKYFIKLGMHGKIYDPIGMYSEGTSNKFISKIGKKAWEFKEVSPKVFELYVNFLRTKNIAWLRNAEREME
jgi:hypothetical protein